MKSIEIADMNNFYKPASIAEAKMVLETARYGDGVNAFTILPVGQETPSLWILVNKDIATSILIETFDRAGFAPDNNDNGLDESRVTVFYLGSPEDEHGVLNSQIISTSQAIAVAVEFMTDFSLSKSINWTEL